MLGVVTLKHFVNVPYISSLDGSNLRRLLQVMTDLEFVRSRQGAIEEEGTRRQVGLFNHRIHAHTEANTTAVRIHVFDIGVPKRRKAGLLNWTDAKE